MNANRIKLSTLELYGYLKAGVIISSGYKEYKFVGFSFDYDTGVEKVLYVLYDIAKKFYFVKTRDEWKDKKFYLLDDAGGTKVC